MFSGFFFFSSRRRHTRCSRDWSSDVCSSDLERIPLEEVYMRMAEELAKRSTCARTQVGSVIATADLTQALGIGYNGNARGLPNACDGPEPGRRRCFHSDANALIMAGARLEGQRRL